MAKNAISGQISPTKDPRDPPVGGVKTENCQNRSQCIISTAQSRSIVFFYRFRQIRVDLLTENTILGQISTTNDPCDPLVGGIKSRKFSKRVGRYPI